MIKQKQIAYRKVFGNEMGKKVIEDLNIFCNGTRSHRTNDPMELMRFEGRREVLLQILNMLKIDITDVYEDYID